jgi:hypothetical protein
MLAVRGYKAPRTSPTITVSPSLTPIFKSDLFTPQASNTCWNLVSESLYLFKIMRKILQMQNGVRQAEGKDIISKMQDMYSRICQI